MIAGSGTRGKGVLEALLVPAIVVLVGVTAFGLGRLSALKEQKTGLTIHPAPAEATH